MPTWTVRRERHPAADSVERILLAGLLVAIVIGSAPGTADRITGYDVTLLYVLVAGSLIVLHGIRTRDIPMTVLQLLATGIVLAAILRQGSGGIPDTDRALHVALLLGVFLLYPFVDRHGLDRLRRLAPYVIGAALVVGVYFFHVVDLPAGSGSATFPVFAGLLMLLNLFFLPRYISRSGLFWAVSRVAAAAALVGFVAYVNGPYELYGMEVQLWPESVGYPFLDGIDAMRSVFPNPNGLGLLTFAGTVAGVIEVRERYASLTAGTDRSQVSLALTIISAIVAILCALGLIFSGSRASLLAAALALCVYLGAALGGRRALPIATGVALVALVLFLLAMAESLLRVDTGRRFELWTAGVEAFLAVPTLLGEGIVSTGELIAPYLSPENRGPTPHNSYLTILLRAGIIGGIGYLILTVGSLIDGLARFRTVDVAVFAFAFGWAVHQLFEAYTLFQLTPGAVLAALAVGFLIENRQPLLSRWREESSPSST